MKLILFIDLYIFANIKEISLGTFKIYFSVVNQYQIDKPVQHIFLE
jgi:hypothetical protein